jgi:uncharacterized Tic20 family protein
MATHERIDAGMTTGSGGTTGATGATGGAPLLNVPLHGGSALSLWPDRLESAGVSYAVANIAWAGLVNDPAAPPGTPPAPAAAWRMTDGQYASATPADPSQAWQILEALFAQRPDLRTSLPPPQASQPGGWNAPPQPSGYPPAYAGYPPQGYAYAQPQNDNQTVMAGLAHLSIFFGALIVPLILWLVNRGKAPYAAQQSKQAFFFHLGVGIIELLFLVPGMAIYFISFFSFMATVPTYSTTPPTQPIGFPFASFGIFIVMYAIVIAVQIVAIVFGIIGAVKAFRGEPFHYPLMSRV